MAAAPAFLRFSATAALLGAAVLLFPACTDQEETTANTTPAAERPTSFTETPELSGDNAYLHCAALCALGPRPSGSPAYEAQMNYLEQHLRSCGWRVERDRFRTGSVGMTNLRAVFGESADVRPILISCHVDTKVGIDNFVGADDGASAAALMLELARVMPKEFATRTELIFLDGEEAFAPRMSDTDGLYGSKYDVARRGKNLPDYQINLDMVGGRAKTIAIPAADSSDAMFAHYQRALRTLGMSEEKWTVWPGSYLDDHRPYLEAGVDTLNLIAYFSGGKWWHTARDNMDRICPHSLWESGMVVMQLLRQLTEE